MPDFQYQPPTGPLSGSEFERQTTRFFQQVQGAADAAQSAASAAQVTANEALERAQAPNLVDGKTTQADASGKITVKDVAIGGDASDLASARGFFYDKYVPWYAGTPADTYLITDFNEFKKPGRYHIRWREGTDAEGGVVTQNNPNAGNGGSYWYDGIMEVDPISSCSYVSSYVRLVQRLIVTTIHNGQVCRIFTRRYINNTSTGEYWETWKAFTFDSDFGDGLRITNYKISVPEMEGATASVNGTAGLVPPPAKSELGKVLGADGEWTYPADVAVDANQSDLASARGQIGEAVQLTDSNFNSVKKVGIYRIVGEPTNGPSIGVSGSSIGVLVVSGRSDNSDNNRLFQTITSEDTICWRTSIDQGSTWTAWKQILTNNIIGDGIRYTKGKISVPEYEGATTSVAGTSGLVPPAAAGQADYVLCGDGEWRDIKTLVAAAQARLADEKTS